MKMTITVINKHKKIRKARLTKGEHAKAKLRLRDKYNGKYLEKQHRKRERRKDDRQIDR